MYLINHKTIHILTWSANCIIASHAAANHATKFAITNTKHYAPVVMLSINDNTKSLQQLKSGFKCTTNWNKFLSKATIQEQNKFLDNFTDPRF